MFFCDYVGYWNKQNLMEGFYIEVYQHLSFNIPLCFSVTPKEKVEDKERKRHKSQTEEVCEKVCQHFTAWAV